MITIKKSYSSPFYLRTGAKLAPSRDFSFFTVLILRPVNNSKKGRDCCSGFLQRGGGVVLSYQQEKESGYLFTDKMHGGGGMDRKR